MNSTMLFVVVQGSLSLALLLKPTKQIFKEYRRKRDLIKRVGVPKPGEKWIYTGSKWLAAHAADKRTRGPWPTLSNEESMRRASTRTVTVLDVKDGWVRYAWNHQLDIAQDEREKVEVFIDYHDRLNTLEVLSYPAEQLTPTPEAQHQINL